jgi:hypothetical protein
VRELRAHVDIARFLTEHVKVIFEGLPIPLKPAVQAGSRNIFDALHELDQGSAI